MADQRISQLGAVTTPTNADEFVVNQGGVSKKVTLEKIREGRSVEGHSHNSDDITQGDTKLFLTTAERSAIASSTDHLASADNPHSVTKAQVGLGDVDNTSDLGKPISTATQAGLDLKSDISDIVDALDSTATNQPLSANQGLVLKGLIDNLNTLVASDDATLDTIQEIVDFIEMNKATLDTLGIDNIAGLTTALAGKSATGHGHTASDITDFDTEVSGNTNVAANTAARHSHSNSTILDETTASFTTTLLNKLNAIETSATADQTDEEIETAYNNQVAIVSQALAEAGTDTDVYRWTPERIKQAVEALTPGGSGGSAAFVTVNGNGSGDYTTVYDAVNADNKFIKLTGNTAETQFMPNGKMDGVTIIGTERTNTVDYSAAGTNKYMFNYSFDGAHLQNFTIKHTGSLYSPVYRLGDKSIYINMTFQDATTTAGLFVAGGPNDSIFINCRLDMANGALFKEAASGLYNTLFLNCEFFHFSSSQNFLHTNQSASMTLGQNQTRFIGCNIRPGSGYWYLKASSGGTQHRFIFEGCSITWGSSSYQIRNRSAQVDFHNCEVAWTGSGEAVYFDNTTYSKVSFNNCKFDPNGDRYWMDTNSQSGMIDVINCTTTDKTIKTAGSALDHEPLITIENFQFLASTTSAVGGLLSHDSMDRKWGFFKNSSGATRARGDIVVLDMNQTQVRSMTVTDTLDDTSPVMGIVMKSTASNYAMPVLLLGKAQKIKVNGTTAIAATDKLGTYSEDGVAAKTTTPGAGFIQSAGSYSTADSNGEIAGILYDSRW